MIHKQIRLQDSSPCPINGKHLNQPMGQVPAAFLNWFMAQEHLRAKYPSVVAYVIERQRYINAELEEEDDDYDQDSIYSDAELEEEDDGD